jgi:hypothetical protein
MAQQWSPCSSGSTDFQPSVPSWGLVLLRTSQPDLLAFGLVLVTFVYMRARASALLLGALRGGAWLGLDIPICFCPRFQPYAFIVSLCPRFASCFFFCSFHSIVSLIVRALLFPVLSCSECFGKRLRAPPGCCVRSGLVPVGIRGLDVQWRVAG